MRVQQVVDAMRKQKHWTIRQFGSSVSCSKIFGVKHAKVIQFRLVSEGNGTYTIAHPNYEFVNIIAHFKSVQKDIRLTLNKAILSSVICSLKSAKIWTCISNKGFLEVNDQNPKSNKSKVTKQLKELLQK